MAMSPRYSPALTVREPRRRRTGLCGAIIGKESTSVGPFFFRKVSFIRAISASLTRRSGGPASSSPSSCFTRRRNASSGGRARPAARWRFTIILAVFLFLVLYRILLAAFPPCHSRCFRRAAGALHHTLHRRG